MPLGVHKIIAQLCKANATDCSGVMRPINSGKGQRKMNATRPQPQTEGSLYASILMLTPSDAF